MKSNSSLELTVTYSTFFQKLLYDYNNTLKSRLFSKNARTRHLPLSFNPFSQEGHPFGFSLVPVFAFLLRLPYGQFTHPLSRYPCIYEKFFQKFLPWKKLGDGGVEVGGGWGGGCNNPAREGVTAKINKFL